MKPTVFSRLVEIIAALFILLFVYAAASKLMAHDSFVITLKTSSATRFASDLLSWVIPASEIVISLLLLMPAFRQMGLMAAFGLMSLFTIYIAWMLIASSHLPCSCGGVISRLSWRQHLLFNIVFTLLAAAGILVNKRLQILSR